MPRQTTNDPFTDALRPTTSNATNPALRAQSSHQSLRSNASGASSRTARTAHASLFAPALSRRATNRSTPSNGILADSDSELENETSVPRARRRVRHASPEAKGKPKGLALQEKKEEDAPEIVKRRADGGYLLGVSGVGETVAVPHVEGPKTAEEVEQEEVDAHYAAISRQFFVSGAALGGKGSRKHEEELEQLQLPMMLRLREQVTERLESERWQYESVDRFQGV